MFVSDMNVLQTGYLLKSSRQTCSVKKVFLKISQNSQENTCARVSIYLSCRPKVADLGLQLY